MNKQFLYFSVFLCLAGLTNSPAYGKEPVSPPAEPVTRKKAILKFEDESVDLLLYKVTWFSKSGGFNDN